MLFLMLLILGGILYFLPLFVAYRKKHFVAIALVNVLFGWTIVGWIFSLIWAIVDRAPQRSTSTVIDMPDYLEN